MKAVGAFSHPLVFKTNLSQNHSSPGNSSWQNQASLGHQDRFVRNLAPRFKGTLDQDYRIDLREGTLGANEVTRVLQELILRDIAKGSDKSSMKLSLSQSAISTSNALALGDGIRLLHHPVDFILEPDVNHGVLRMALTLPNSLMLMSPHARLNFGPLKTVIPGDITDEIKISNELDNEYTLELETAIMNKSGLTDRKKVHEDLSNGRILTPLQALYYGPKGLIDGIPVGYEQVITREDMDAYIKGHPRLKSDEALQAFLATDKYLEEIPSRPLSALSGAAVSNAQHSNYKSLSQLGGFGPKEKAEITPGKVESPRPTFFILQANGQVKRSTSVAPHQLMTPTLKDPRISIQNIPTGQASFLNRDMIFFNSLFNATSANQIEKAFVALDDKYPSKPEAQHSHIGIMLNSLGGEINALNRLIDKMASLHRKVDIIAYGTVASCGAIFLAAATGNRFATPNARILIHQPRLGGSSVRNIGESNAIAQNTDQLKLDFINILHRTTGRTENALRRDIDRDYYLNPLEALFYGPKGLIDGILIGPDQVLTREGVNQYLVQQLGSQRAVDGYIEKRLSDMRQGRLNVYPAQHDDGDPFDNPSVTIAKVAQGVTKRLSEVEAFKPSLPIPQDASEIDYYNILP